MFGIVARAGAGTREMLGTLELLRAMHRAGHETLGSC